MNQMETTPWSPMEKMEGPNSLASERDAGPKLVGKKKKVYICKDEN
jgi:hypothetical protein